MRLNKLNAAKLYAIVSKIKELQAEESELKSQFKDSLGDGSFRFGPYLITISDAERKTLDNESIEILLGSKIKKGNYPLTTGKR